jgi:hypothetical protein
MKCISCEIDINPKWKHAIDQNICPFCGQSIMEELLKGLLTTLQDTMEKLQSYPDQLNDWLLSNYNFIKTDSPNLKNYVPKEAIKELRKELDNEEFDRKRSVIKVKTGDGEEEVVTEKVQSDSKTAGFFERAELIKRGTDDGDVDSVSDEDDVQLTPVKAPTKPKAFKTQAQRTQHFKKLKEKIETEGSAAVISEKGLAAMIDPSNLDSASPEDVAAYQSMIGDGDIINSALPSSLDDEDSMTDRILAANLAAKGNKGKGHSGDYNPQDVQSLQRMQSKVRDAHKAFENGDNRDGKNGFSRS